MKLTCATEKEYRFATLDNLRTGKTILRRLSELAGFYRNKIIGSPAYSLKTMENQVHLRCSAPKGNHYSQSYTAHRTRKSMFRRALLMFLLRWKNYSAEKKYYFASSGSLRNRHFGQTAQTTRAGWHHKASWQCQCQ